jgi:hypothetical protein
MPIQFWEIYGEMAVQYGDKCQSQIKFMDLWPETSAVDEARSDSHRHWLVSKEQIEQWFPDNRAISIDKTAFELSNSYGKKLCKNGLRPNQRYLILMGSENVSKIRPNALKTWRLRTKNKIYVSVMSNVW